MLDGSEGVALRVEETDRREIGVDVAGEGIVKINVTTEARRRRRRSGVGPEDGNEIGDGIVGDGIVGDGIVPEVDFCSWFWLHESVFFSEWRLRLIWLDFRLF